MLNQNNSKQKHRIKIHILNILNQIPLRLNKEQTNFVIFVLQKMSVFSKETFSHLINTYEIAHVFAKGLNMSQTDAGVLELSALVHDFGKLKIENSLLHSKNLDSNGFETIKSHVQLGYDMMKNILPENVCLISLHHHEKLNGCGYPQHLESSRLSDLDKIVTVCDIASALLQKRSYKKALSKAETTSILNKMALNNEIDARLCNFVISNYIYSSYKPKRSHLTSLKTKKSQSLSNKKL